jgi:large subunit ribosomal protein L6
MSRIGRKPISVPEGVTVDVGSGVVSVKGPKGELSQTVDRDMTIALDDSTLTVERPTDRGPHRALHGLTRSLLANMVEGVTDGYEKRLEIQGVGYRARLQGKALELSVGFSHPVSVPAPEGIEFEVPQQTEVVVRGIDKQLVGETAARIRRVRPPEPYKGKGIRYAGEHVRRKVGKRAEEMAVATKNQQRLRRRRRVRAKIRGTAERPRVSVFRSNRGISAQLIDDDAGRTLVAVSWTEDELRKVSRAEQPKRAGELLAERAKAAGVETVVFDRGGYRFHGRVAALAEGAREGGLKF